MTNPHDCTMQYALTPFLFYLQPVGVIL